MSHVTYFFTSLQLVLPPATKLRQGIVFTPVCHSVHGGSLCPNMHHRSHDQGVSVLGVSVWGSLSGGLFPGGLCHGGLCLGVSFQGASVLVVSVWGSLSRGSLSRGISVYGVSFWWGLCPVGVSVMETPRTVKSGRYESYWNTFLLLR